MRFAVAITLLFASTGTAWACPPPQADRGAIGAVLFFTTLVVLGSWIGAFSSVCISRDPFGTAISPCGIERLARRKRTIWLCLAAVLAIPSVAISPSSLWSPVAISMALVALGPLALAIHLQIAIVRLRRGAHVLANERHVVIVGPRGNATWMRADPRRLAQCAMPRATIVRSHD